MPWLKRSISSRTGKTCWIAYWKVGRKRRQKTLAAGTQREANLEFAKLILRLGRKGSARPSRMTLTEAIENHLEGVRVANRPATHTTYCSRLQIFLAYCHSYGIAKIDQVTPEIVEGYKRAQATALSKRTVNHDLVIVSGLFSVAVRFGWIAENPVKKVRRFRLPERDPQTWKDEELDAVLAEYDEGDADREALIVLAYTGMRPGEARHLEWTDVDFDRGSIHIGPKLHLGWDTKNHRSRKVPMHAEARAAFLRLHRRRTVGLSLVFESRVFPAKPRADLLYMDRFYRIRKRIGAPHLTLMGLRHTFATRLIRCGTNLYTLRNLLGHADVRTTQQYPDPETDTERAAVDRIPGRLADRLADPSEANGQA